MKVVAFDGAPNEKFHTATMLQYSLERMERHGIATEYICIREHDISICKNCGYCRIHPGVCVQNDSINALFEKMCEAQGILMASNAALSNVTAEMKCFIERICRMAISSTEPDKPSLLAHKVGAPFISIPERTAYRKSESDTVAYNSKIALEKTSQAIPRIGYGARTASFYLINAYCSTGMIIPFGTSMNYLYYNEKDDWKSNTECMFVLDDFTDRMIRIMKQIYCNVHGECI